MKALTFKVEHGDWSAVLMMNSEHTLYTFADAIIHTVGFDMDHCFGFYDNLKRITPSKEEYTLFADVGEEASEHDTGVEQTLVATVFTPRKKMIFLFDYGDDWRFLVTCLGEEARRGFKCPKVLSNIGTPPVQYPPYEDDF